MDELRQKIDRVRAVLPDELSHRWRLPPGRTLDGPDLPSGLRRLYELTHAPRAGWLVFHDVDELGDAADDFDDWELEVEDPDQWVRFARCAEADLYVHRTNGTVTTISAADLKAGRLRLRELAAGVLEFFAEFAIGPQYPIILEDPAAQRILPAGDDDWVRVLLSAGVIDESSLAELESRWASQYVDPATLVPRRWDDTPASDAERSLTRKLDRLREVGDDVYVSSGAVEQWNQSHSAFYVLPGTTMCCISDATEPLWRLQRLLSCSALGPLYFYTEERIIDHTKVLPRRFASLGLDEDGARHWFAVGVYHRKAELLLHRETGEVTGLEPAPASRLRHLHTDLMGFVDEYGLGTRHHELIYHPGSRAQATAARQWVDFLAACEVAQ